MNKRRYIKVQLAENGIAEKGPCFIDPVEAINLEDLFDGADPGRQYILTMVDMTPEEHAALPDFEGF